MSQVPSLSYSKIVAALQRDGWVVIRQRGSHIQLHKHTETEVMRLTIPAHRPVKKTTLAKVLKQARIELERFLELI